MRLFIAIDFSELKDYFKQVQASLPQNSRLSLTCAFHLTLKFLGEVTSDKVSAITKAMESVRHRTFSVFLDSIGTFPNKSRPRVIWIGIKPQDNVLDLQKDIDESLNGLFRKEKSFKAHITLARVKYAGDSKSFVEQLKRIMVENRKVEIKGFKLIKSALTPEGAVYEDIKVFD